ncbi:MAG: carbohydrate ABC transporter permease [Kineosporiaceae bacterium]
MDDVVDKLAVLGVGILAWVIITLIIVAVSDLGRGRAKERWQIVLFLAPALLLLILGLVIPAIRTTILAFYGPSGDEFVGWDNVTWMFTQQQALTTLRNTALWVLLAPVLSTAIGLLYAILVDRTRGEAVAKTFVFLPMAISFVGASIIWGYVYAFDPTSESQTGLVNAIIVVFGGESIQLLNESSFALNTFLLIVVLVWIQAGFAMVILSAAIKGIPDDIVEAARIDGTTPVQRFFYITLPSIRPALIVVLATITITTLKVFDIVRTATGGNFNTSVVANEFYVQAFVQNNLGRGAVLAAFLFVLVLPLVAYQIRILRQTQEIR